MNSESQNQVVVYDGNGFDRLGLIAWRRMVVELWEHRELIRRLIQRNIQGQFRQSFLGYLWIAFPPIGTTVVFSLLREARVLAINDQTGAFPYAVFVMIGSMMWGYFTQVVLMAGTSIANAGALVTKIYFPREVLVISAIGNAVVNLGVRLLVLAIACMILGYLPSWQAGICTIVMIPMTALALGMGLILAPLHTMTNDTGRAVEFAFQFGLFLAPAVYPTPAWQAGGGLLNAVYWLHVINPFSHFLYAIHGFFEGRGLINPEGFAIASVFSFLVLLVGWRFFDACEPLLAERL